jgi:hypothetical protein
MYFALSRGSGGPASNCANDWCEREKEMDWGLAGQKFFWLLLRHSELRRVSAFGSGVDLLLFRSDPPLMNANAAH